MKLTEFNNQKFWATPSQVRALEQISSTRGGGIAVVNGYISTSDRVTPEKANIRFISRVSTQNIYRNAIKAIGELDDMEVFTRLMENIASNSKVRDKFKDLKISDVVDEIAAKKQAIVESYQKTLDGESRDDNYRAAHDRCYLNIDKGIKIHYKTLKDADGIAQPVELQGYPIMDSLMLTALVIDKKVIEKGEYKVKNSGIPVLVRTAIESLLPRNSKVRTLSLKEDNFDSLSIDGNQMLAEEFKGVF